MIRIPDFDRFELRLADGAANPYLLPAAIIAAGLDGIENKVDPGDRSNNNSYSDPLPPGKVKRLPANLLDALGSLEKNRVFKAAFGESFIASYLKLKYQQWNEYSSSITKWELDNTLNC